MSPGKVTMPATLVSIWRNKRRSLAMLCGIILGTVIISSVVIYSGILQQENYESIVKSVSYEAAFTLIEPGKEADLWSLVGDISDDERIESMAVLGGSPPSFSLGGSSPHGGFGLRLRSQGHLYATIDGPGVIVETENEQEPLEISPFFVRQNFTATSIYGKMIGDRLEGDFDLSPAPAVNATVLPRTTANRMNINVGDTLAYVNVTLELQRRQGVGTDQYNLAVRDVYVSGIYDAPETIAAGIFTDRLRSEALFLNTALLYDFPNALLQPFENEGYFFLAMKIDGKAFDLEDMENLNNEIDRLINDITEQSGDRVEGINQVSPLLLPFDILNSILLFFDYVLVLPTIYLSTYLLIFGLLLSLEERRREVGIFKVQGADARQIFRLLRNEVVLLFAFGIAVGYLLSIVAAWLITSSVGFLTFNVHDVGTFWRFLYFDFWALFIAALVIGVIVLVAVWKKGKSFIALEVSQAVQKMEWAKTGFIRKNKIDLAMLGYGAVAVILVLLPSAFGIEAIGGFELEFGFMIDIFLIRVLGTICFWLGGILSGARIAKWLALKLERRFLSLRPLRDVSNIIRSGLKRRGDVDRLVMIIVLTLSVATLGIAQGHTDERFTIRNLEYEIGADYQLEFAVYEDQTPVLEALPGVAEVMGVPMLAAYILSTPAAVYGIDPARADMAIWHHDSFISMTSNEALKMLARADNEGRVAVFLGETLAENVGSGPGDRVRLKVPVISLTSTNTTVAFLEVEVLGLFDHAPGSIDSRSIICSYPTIQRLKGLIGNFTTNLTAAPEALTYLVNQQPGADRQELRKAFDGLAGLSTIHDLEASEGDLGSEMNFGIPGLLTLMFVIALIASLTSAFAFSAIIIKRRNREFAVLQTIGASRGQIYKTAIGENALLMLVSVLWGTLIGLGVTYMMNEMLEFMGFVLGRGELARTVFIPWLGILIICMITLAGMLGAVALSARRAARQDLAVATRVL